MRNFLESLDDECGVKAIQKSVFIFEGLKCGIIKNIMRLFQRHNPCPRSNFTILSKFPEQTAQLQDACCCNCAYFLEDFRSPQLWSVSVGYPSVGYREKARRSTGPVALSSCTVQIQVKLSVQQLQYHGLTASRWLDKWCSLY